MRFGEEGVRGILSVKCALTLAQQRVAGYGEVPPSPKMPSRVRSGNFGYSQNVIEYSALNLIKIIGGS